MARAGAGIVTRLFGNAVSGIAGFAGGTALGPVLTPAVQLLRNDVNARYPYVPPDVGALAAGVAQGQVDPEQAGSWAKMHGIGDRPFSALVSIASVGPPLAAAYEAWRRGDLTDARFETAVKRLGIEDAWLAALKALKDERLEPVQIANAIHRGLIPDPGLLAVPPPSGTGNVPAYPTYQIDALAEAEASGISRERLGALVGLTGLPMGVHEAAQAVFRKIITRTDYSRAVAEGNTRNEWGDAIFAQSRQIPTARDFLENALRGYRTLAEALDGAALHGMTPEHATLLYQNQGRPLNIRQITQALARGAKFNPEPGEIRDPYDAAIVEGNLKPGYYELAKSLRYTMPSVFAIRQLAQSGVWNEDKTRTRLEWAGWLPADAADVAKAWTSGTGAAGDPHVGKAETQLWTRTHSSYIAEEIDAATAQERLTTLAIPAADQARVMSLWDSERALYRKQLSPTEVKKAYLNLAPNHATGQPWTRQDAIDALVDRGYNPTDAEDFLDIPLRG
jgi:hypothetical protein